MNFTPAVKNIIIINVLIYLFQLVGRASGIEELLYNWFALSYINVFAELKVWTLLSYAFLHGGFMHILFNMLIFFFIGTELERAWGTKKFLQFYMWNCLGAGICIFIYAVARVHLFQQPIAVMQELTIGASGGIFALLLAYSLLFAERQITLLLFFIIPVTIRAKFLVWFSLAITFGAGMFSSASISHIGHVGGVFSAIVFLLIRKNDSDFYQTAIEQKLLFKNIFRQLKPRNKKNNPTRFNHYEKNNANQNSLDETNMSDREIERRIDELLDIISTKGLKHLNNDERAFLNRVSLLYRHKFPQ